MTKRVLLFFSLPPLMAPALMFLFVLSSTVEAFVPPSFSTRCLHRTATSLQEATRGEDASPYSSNSNQTGDVGIDLDDQMRQSFEQLFASEIRQQLHKENENKKESKKNLEAAAASIGSTNTTYQNALPPPPPMRTAEPNSPRSWSSNCRSQKSTHYRRLLEMELLQSLEDSDDAIDALVNLWLQEGSSFSSNDDDDDDELSDSVALLQSMETSCSPGLFEEEYILRNMVQQHNNNNDNDDDDWWCEPFVRLATLLFTKRQYLESLAWCEAVLYRRPWHFEAASLKLHNTIRLGLSLREQLRAARCTIPPLNPRTDHRARRKWVETAVQEARSRMERKEEEEETEMVRRWMEAELGTQAPSSSSSSSAKSNNSSSNGAGVVEEGIIRQLQSEEETWQ